MKAIKKGLNRYMPKHSNVDVEKVYKMGKELGSGNFAVVRLATRRDNNKKFAMKIIDKSLCVGKEGMIETEVTIAKQVNHPNIIRMYDVYDTPEKLYLALEYVEGGEVFDRIVDMGSFTEMDASRICRQMTSAIQYLHSIDIVHRDLKPENLLFRTKEPDSDVMIADFGLSKIVSDSVMLNTACGTPNYVAPEVLRQNGYGKEVDLWSIGVITYIMLCGYPPFYDDNDSNLFRKIMKGEYKFHEVQWEQISETAKGLIAGLLQVSPETRFTPEQVLRHPWVTGEKALNINISQSVSTSFKEYSNRKAQKKAAESTAGGI